MKKAIIASVITFIFVLLILSSIVVFAGNETHETTLEDKVTQEIHYLDKCLISILGDFNVKNNTSEKDNNQIDQQNNTQNKQTSNGNEKYVTKWEEIRTQIEELYQIWNTISIDLHSMNVESSSILAFSDYLNDSMQNVNKKDKTKSMEAINKLYQLLPKYSESGKPNSKETNLLKIKSNVVQAYIAVSNEDWKIAQIQLMDGSKQFTNLLNSVIQNFNNQTSVNQCYILVNELNKSVQLKDKDIFFLEYENLMKKIETI